MKKCLIIGAGISGLMAARKLQEQNFEVSLMEKSPGVGGRMATRRIENAVFDHGAQYFTVRTSEFENIVGSWKKNKIVQEWSQGFYNGEGKLIHDGYPRYFSKQGMTAIAKHLAQNLQINLNQRAFSLHYRQKSWQVLTEDSKEYEADVLVLTPPVPQTLQLLESNNLSIDKSIFERLQNIVYDKCLALMVIMENKTAIQSPGGLSLSGEPILWMADNQIKGISGKGPAITIHCGADFSEKYWEMDDKSLAQLILHTAGEWLKAKHVSYQIKRWRYSQPSVTYRKKCFIIEKPALLVLAGDAFGGPRVEGAALSGMAAADEILRRQ